MEKTKLGVSVGIFGAFLYVAALFGGYIAITLLAGYVLLMESNEWLKKTAVKAVATLACFSFLSLLVGLIPDAVDVITGVFNVFFTLIVYVSVSPIFTLSLSTVLCISRFDFFAVKFAVDAIDANCVGPQPTSNVSQGFLTVSSLSVTYS